MSVVVRAESLFPIGDPDTSHFLQLKPVYVVVPAEAKLPPDPHVGASLAFNSFITVGRFSGAADLLPLSPDLSLIHISEPTRRA